MALIRLRVLTAFNTYRVGDIIEREPGAARQMIDARWYGRRFVEEVKDEPAPVAAVAEPENEPEPEPAGAWTTRTERRQKRSKS